jgi:hypothetical protein
MSVSPQRIKKLYLLGFLAGVQVDTVAYPVFWWELQTIHPDFAERLNMDVRNTLLDRVTI